MFSRDLIIDLIGKGKTIQEITDAVGCGHSTVYNVAKANNLMICSANRNQYDSQNEIILDMRSNGKTYGEIASVLNITYTAVKLRCAKLGVKCKPGERAKRSNDPNNFAHLRKDEKRVAQQILDSNYGVEYVSGYTNNCSPVNVRCLKCGHVFSLNVHFIYEKHIGVANCPECLRIRQEEKRKEYEHQQILKEQQERERLASITGEQVELAFCKQCGTLFIPTSRSVYCSEQCRKRENNKRCRDKRLRRLKHLIVDNDITLEALAKRDNNICWLCGKPVDWDDINADRSIAGNDYPSIDHVVPLVNGGEHSWSNVALAHRICNSIKSDNVDYDAIWMRLEN